MESLEEHVLGVANVVSFLLDAVEQDERRQCSNKKPRLPRPEFLELERKIRAKISKPSGAHALPTLEPGVAFPSAKTASEEKTPEKKKPKGKESNKTATSSEVHTESCDPPSEGSSEKKSAKRKGGDLVENAKSWLAPKVRLDMDPSECPPVVKKRKKKAFDVFANLFDDGKKVHKKVKGQSIVSKSAPESVITHVVVIGSEDDTQTEDEEPSEEVSEPSLGTEGEEASKPREEFQEAPAQLQKNSTEVKESEFEEILEAECDGRNGSESVGIPSPHRLVITEVPETPMIPMCSNNEIVDVISPKASSNTTEAKPLMEESVPESAATPVPTPQDESEHSEQITEAESELLQHEADWPAPLSSSESDRDDISTTNYSPTSENLESRGGVSSLNLGSPALMTEGTYKEKQMMMHKPNQAVEWQGGHMEDDDFLDADFLAALEESTALKGPQPPSTTHPLPPPPSTTHPLPPPPFQSATTLYAASHTSAPSCVTGPGSAHRVAATPTPPSDGIGDQISQMLGSIMADLNTISDVFATVQEDMSRILLELSALDE